MRVPLPRFHGAYGLLLAALGPGIALAWQSRDAMGSGPAAGAARAVWVLAGAIVLGFLALGCLEGGAVGGPARRHLGTWIALYGAGAIALFAIAAPHLDLRALAWPGTAGIVLLLVRTFPPHPRLDRPIPREVLGMAALGLALPAMLRSFGLELRPAAALYAVYVAFFGLRLALVRGFLAGRSRHLTTLSYPMPAMIVACGLFAVALVLGLDLWTLVALAGVLALGTIRFARDRTAQRSVRAVGLEELAVAATFALVVGFLGHRTTGT